MPFLIMGQACLIRRFQQAGPQGTVHLEHRVHHLLGNLLELVLRLIGSSPKRVGNFVTFFQLEIYIRGFSEAWLRCPMVACCIVVPKLI